MTDPKHEPVAWQYRFRPKGASAYYWTSWAQGRRPVADESEEHVEFQERSLYPASTVEALTAQIDALRKEVDLMRATSIKNAQERNAFERQLYALKEENERLRARWMPIETAPRDGTPILAFGPEPVSEPSFVTQETRWELYGKGSIAHADFVAGKGPSGGWGWHEPVMNWGCKWTPTHWMPLPNPPAALTQPQLPDSGESVEGGE